MPQICLWDLALAGGGNNVKVPYPYEWTTANRPTSPNNGLSGYNTDSSQWEYWNGSSWVQFAAGGSGSVNTGSANELAYYATSGTAVSGLLSAASSVLITDSGSIPQLSTTLPSLLNIPLPNIIGVTNGSNAAAGSVGEYVTSNVPVAAGVSLTNGIPANVSSISLSAGDWDIYGNVTIISSGSNHAVAMWCSITSATLPEESLYTGTSLIAGATLANFQASTPFLRISISLTTTVYLSAQSAFSSGTSKASGSIFARRVR